MQEFIATISNFFGEIGAENLGAFILFIGVAGSAIWRGLRVRTRSDVYVEPLMKRLERMEHESDIFEERQMHTDARLARVEGQLGVLQTMILSKKDYHS